MKCKNSKARETKGVVNPYLERKKASKDNKKQKKKLFSFCCYLDPILVRKRGWTEENSGAGRNLEKIVDRRFGREVRNEEMENNADKLVEIVFTTFT
jgi:hypothetical protein